MSNLNKRHLHLTVSQETAGERIDRFLAGACPDISRECWKKVIATGGVHLNGRRWRQCSTCLRQGDRVEVFIDGRPLEPWLPGAERILYRDRWLLALDKPAGIDCQPTPARFQGTVYQGVLDYLGRRDRRHGRKPDIGMVQRLDRDTSGVMVFSIHPQAHKGLTRQFTEHRLRKFYLALVSGTMPDQAGVLRSNLARSRADNLVRSVSKGGRGAVTRYRVLAREGEVSLVLVEPVTGRSHQIRAHCSEAGCPLVGDLPYGGPAAAAGVAVHGQLLHAWQLHLKHPVSLADLRIRSGLPEQWTSVLSQVGIRFDQAWSPEQLLPFCENGACIEDC
ncbi:MAG: RluA family pseudouridine synthase [Deltaproteobacteria bacterium]|nr:MAG: RluA family pseudouridine synthase [Deltaproteobacteria bacterium]